MMPSEYKYTGRWTTQEHIKFMEGLRLYGKNWKKIEQLVGTRSGAQVRSHAQKFFNKLEGTNKKSEKVLKENHSNWNQNQFPETSSDNISDFQSDHSYYIRQMLASMANLNIMNSESLVYQLVDINHNNQKHKQSRNLGFQPYKDENTPVNSIMPVQTIKKAQ